MNVRFSLLRAAVAVALAAFVSNPASAEMLGSRTASVLYVADNVHNAVYLFNAQNLNAPMLGTIYNGVSGPSSIALDSRGDLYVANAGTGDVAIFKHNATSPYRKIAPSRLGTPAALAVSSDNGLVVAYDGRDGRSATLAFFNAGHSQAARRISIPGGNNAQVSIGALTLKGDDLYVSLMRSPNGPSDILKFAPGSDRGVSIGIGSGTGQAFDARGDFYVDGGASITVYSPGQRQEMYAISNLVNAGQIAVAPDGTLFVPNGQHRVCGNFYEAGYIAEYAPGSENPMLYLQSSSLQNPVSLALLLGN